MVEDGGKGRPEYNIRIQQHFSNKPNSFLIVNMNYSYRISEAITRLFEREDNHLFGVVIFFFETKTLNL